MCMKIKNKSRLRTTNKDRSVFVVRKFKFGKIYSPFFSFKWTMNKIERTAIDESPLMIHYNTIPIIQSGFHSFKKKKDADLLKDELNKTSFLDKYKTFKAIIPKDSKYWIGTSYKCSPKTDNLPNYISNKLKLIKQY